MAMSSAWIAIWIMHPMQHTVQELHAHKKYVSESVVSSTGDEPRTCSLGMKTTFPEGNTALSTHNRCRHKLSHCICYHIRLKLVTAKTTLAPSHLTLDPKLVRNITTCYCTTLKMLHPICGRKYLIMSLPKQHT